MINDEIGKKFLVDYLERVVRHMPGWKVNKIHRHNGVYIQLDSLRKFYFFFYKRKVRCDAVFPGENRPRYWGFNEDIDSFSFNIDRKPEHIANKLNKLLTDYFSLFEKCLEAYRDRQALSNRHKNLAAMIAQKYPCLSVRNREEETDFSTYFGKITLHRKLNVSLELRQMPADLVFPLLEALSRHAR